MNQNNNNNKNVRIKILKLNHRILRRFKIFAYYKICTASPILILYSGKPQNPVPSQNFWDIVREEIIYKCIHCTRMTK